MINNKCQQLILNSTENKKIFYLNNKKLCQEMTMIHSKLVQIVQFHIMDKTHSKPQTTKSYIVIAALIDSQKLYIKTGTRLK